jgi:hypothetical protein
MYGLFVPMLFPVCFLGILNMYITEVINLTYFNRKPPMYDGELIRSALYTLKFAPIFMFAFGYWALSNS